MLKHTWSLSKFTLFLGLILAGVLNSGTPVLAIGEKYAWEDKDKDTIQVSGGNFSGSFILSKVSEGKFSDRGGEIRDKISGCLIFVTLTVGNPTSRVSVSLDPTSATSDSNCDFSKASDISARFDKQTTIDESNTDRESINNKALIVNSVVTGGEFPAEKDTITINKDKKQIEKKSTTKETDGGYTVEFSNIPLGQYEACSEALKMCVDFRQEGGNILTTKTVIISKEVNGTSCDIDGIGWIICPAMNALAKWNDAAFGFLDNLLNIRPELLQDKATQKAWRSFLDIANVLFVIAFLFIIYSQITGGLLTNYGVKKLIPRLVITAVLVNASYILCQLAVDLSNVLGYGMYQLLGNGIQVGTDAATAGPSGWEKTMGWVLAGGAVVLLVVAICLAPVVLLAFLLILLIVVARQAFVILLVVIAPLAFVAYLLPNTEQWFKKWYKAFVAVLMVFPVIGIVFGASSLASKILIGVAGDGANADGSGSNDDQLLAIMALGVQAIPLFAVPALLKGSLAAAGSIGSKISGIADRTQNRAMKSAAANTKRHAESLESRMATRNGALGVLGGYRTRRNFRRKSMETASSQRQEEALAAHIDNNPTRFSDRDRATAIAARQKISSERIGNSIALLQDGHPETLVQRSVAQLEAANASGDVEAARAATQILTTKTGSRGIQMFHDTVRRIEEQPGGLNGDVSEAVRADVSSAGLKGKDRSLDTWSRFEGGRRNLADHDNYEGTPRGLNEAELAGQSTQQLSHFAESGSMSREQAERVLASHERGTIHLDEAKLTIFRGRVEGR